MRTQTISVFWKGKFGGKAVQIDADQFNAKLHRLESEGPWPAAEAPKAETAKSKTKA